MIARPFRRQRFLFINLYHVFINLIFRLTSRIFLRDNLVSFFLA